MPTSPQTENSKISKALKKYLLTGILVWLPIIVTIWVIGYIVGAADHLVDIIPKRWQPQTLLGFEIPGIGLILAVVIVFITGLLAANMLGRRFLAGWDSLINRIPVVKSIYSSVKKVSESLLSDSRQSFKTPVLVPFPQSNIWTIAFVSGKPSSVIQKELNSGAEQEEYLSVYVPTTPNPTGGYYIFVRKTDVRPLNMSVDDALKYVISLGMVQSDQIDKQAEHSS